MNSVSKNRNSIYIHKQEKWPEYSYADIYENICKLGTYLINAGIKPDCGRRVAICLSRTPEYVISFLACLLYGYCAVLLEDTYPEKRIEYILRDSGTEILIDTELIKTVLAGTYEIRKPSLEADEMTDAVITYTSGSTGNPKGVVHGQLDIADAVKRIAKCTELSSSDIVSAAAPFPFVTHFFDLLAPFVSGSGVVIASAEIRMDASKLAAFHRYHRVTAALIPPKVLRIYRKTTDTLRLVITTGEKIYDVSPNGYRLLALYGQTEMYGVTTFDIDRPYDLTPIGKPLDGVNAYILDADGKETAEGELCFSGSFFKGYLNDPEKTGHTLVKNPFKNLDGHPYMVRTGDIGRRLEDGNLVLLNRKDWMIKINGMRVEPGEVECTLRKMDGIRDAVVKSFEEDSHRVFLCAYYIAGPGTDLAADNIRAFLGSRLPPYMIPSFFIKMDAFPLNANGKVNRLALVKPDISSFLKEYVAPENPIQKRVCSAFAKVLSLDRVGITDDFFALGGDSIKVMAAAEELTDLPCNVRIIYKYRTPEKVSEAIENLEFLDRISEPEAERAKSLNPAIIPYQRYYIDYQLYAPKKTGTLMPFYLKIPSSKYSAEDIASALEKVLKHFAIFGTVFEFGRDGALRLSYRPERIQPVEIAVTSEKEAMAWCVADVKRPMPIRNELPYRIRLFVCEDKYILYLIFQHFLMDGTSQMNMLKALMDTLEGKNLWVDAYYYYLDMLENTHKLPEYRQKLGELSRVYFNDQYDKLPRFDHRTENRENITRYYQIAVPYSELAKKAEEKHISFGRLLNAAGLLALREYNGSDKVQICWIYTGRSEKWMEDIIGLTMAAIPIAIDFTATNSIDELLEEIKRQDGEIIPYATLSPALEKNSPVQNDCLTMIYEGGLKYPENIFENASEEYLFTYRTSAPNAMNCVFLPSPAENIAILCININAGVYREETAAAFEKLVEKYMLLILGL